MLAKVIACESVPRTHCYWKISYKINIDPDINTLEYKVPSLILQPYCENSIKHGLANKDTGGKIIIGISKEQNNIKCTIEDNGIGRLRSILQKQKQNKKHKSLGTKISAERISILNDIYNKDIDITYSDLNDQSGNPSGTRVEIILPILK